jgi:hypothetical protein
MRHILIDSARKKARLKRGGDWQRLDLDAVEVAANADSDSLLAVHEALEEFAREDPGKVELVKLRFFGGLSLPQAVMGALMIMRRLHTRGRPCRYGPITTTDQIIIPTTPGRLLWTKRATFS